MLQMEEMLGKYPHQLSGGQQQRVALARILVNEPEFLLLDEPFSALDAYLRDQLQIQVKEILEKFDWEVLLVSHSRDEVYHLCGRLSLVEKGKILETGNTKEVFARPRSRSGAILTGCKNIAGAKKWENIRWKFPNGGFVLRQRNRYRRGFARWEFGRIIFIPGDGKTCIQWYFPG